MAGGMVAEDRESEAFYGLKVMIIDEEIVVTGSYNFSYSAQEKNDENTLVIHDEQVAAEFLEEFYKIYAEAK